jgi:ATP-dependent RNA helicase DeaD
MSFDNLGLNEKILMGVKDAGFTEASPIQQQAIPVVLEGHDMVARAQTGTGKTAAFGLPIMSKIDANGGVQALIITPTRELCMQVSDELYKLGRHANIKTVAVYGGQSISRQVDLIGRGAQVVVATPGRLLDHLLNGRLRDFNPQYVVLDEADEMLDMGFLEDIEEIFKFLPASRQTLLFSATMPREIRNLAEKILKEPKTINIESKEVTSENIEQFFYVVEDWERSDAIVRLIDFEDPSRAIVFCRTKKDADELSTTLVARGYPAKALHGDLEQRQREEVVKSFKAGKVLILVATDVAARGLDINDVSHVFNYHIPLDPESYVHRIGRTGRAGKTGKAVTLVKPLEFRELNRIKQVTKAQIYHMEVPTLEDVKSKKIVKLVDKIKHQVISDEATELFASMADEMDTATLCLKLLSKIVSKNKAEGPSHIGIKGKNLEKMLEARANDRGGDRGGSRGRFGGNRGGSGGGYRGSNDRGGSGGGGYRGSNDRGDRAPRVDGDRAPRPEGDRAPRPEGDRGPRPEYRRDDRGGQSRPPRDRDSAPRAPREGGEGRGGYRGR